jgi:hypothetical protein
MRLVLPSLVLVVPLALALAACGADSESASIAASDLAAIAEPAPPVPEGAYRPDNSSARGGLTAAELRRRAGNAEDRAILSALEKAGFEHGYEKAWTALDLGDGAAAQVSLFLVRADSSTGDVLRAMEHVYRRSLGEELEEVDASGLGGEGWAGRTSGGDESHVYAWRAGNLVALVYLGCYQRCAAADGVEDAARAYADAVDDRIEEVLGPAS